MGFVNILQILAEPGWDRRIAQTSHVFHKSGVGGGTILMFMSTGTET